MKYIKPPTLSTSFSESGKSAKKRFENILNTKAKKAGVIAFVVVICIVLSAGALVACNSSSIGIIGSSDGPTSIFVSSDTEKQIKDLYNSKIKYVGDNSGVAKIAGLLPFAEGVKLENIELQTDGEPYGVTLNYIIDDYDKAVIDDTVKSDGFYKNAKLMLCLIDNADSITVNIKDEIKYRGAMYSNTYLRTDFDNTFHKHLREFSKDYSSFKAFFESISSNTEILSDKQRMEIAKSVSLATGVEQNSEVYQLANIWAEAWMTRDGKQRYDIMSSDMKSDFESEQERINGDEGSPWVIRWSSPWVTSYAIQIEGDTALITYKYTDSTAAIYEGDERITIGQENGRMVVVGRNSDYEETILK